MQSLFHRIHYATIPLFHYSPYTCVAYFFLGVTRTPSPLFEAMACILPPQLAVLWLVPTLLEKTLVLQSFLLRKERLTA